MYYILFKNCTRVSVDFVAVYIMVIINKRYIEINEVFRNAFVIRYLASPWHFFCF